MARAPKLQAKFTMGQWMVSVPPAMTATGKRERRFFGSNQTEAEKYAAGLRGKYHKGKRGLLTTAEAALAADAIKLLAPLGINLLEAATIILRQHEAAGAAETFRERWLRYQRNHEMNWRPTYVDQVYRMENWLGPDFMGMQVGAITPEIIRMTLSRKAKAKSTMALRTRMVKSVLAERGKERRAEKIEILSRYQIRKLFAVTRHDLPARRAVALLLFAGIRPGVEDGEIMKLDWEDFHDGLIYISSDTSKTGADRHIPITPRLKQLLGKHPSSGPVAPMGWKRRWTAIRRAVRISDKLDICRHTFGSCFLAVYGEDKAKMAMGHTKGSDTLFRRYRKAVTEQDAREYFGLDET